MDLRSMDLRSMVMLIEEHDDVREGRAASAGASPRVDRSRGFTIGSVMSWGCCF